ncbi:MAG: YesL family protein [Lachnospiraceae bacterium]|nr:YesL family protein [Lachnospiraceae bacterium]
MRSVFDPESPILQFITKIVYSVWLNILWFVCSLPVVTIGPSTTALFYACQKMARDEEGYITRSFFHSFRENLKQGICIGLIMTGSGAFLCFDAFVLLRLYKTSAFWAVLSAAFLVACAAWFIVLMWIFPLLAHFNNTTAAMFKNAIMIGMRFLLCTVLMAAIYIGMALLVIHVMTPLVIFGMGTCAFLNSLLMKRILIMCEKSDEDEEDEAGKEII